MSFATDPRKLFKSSEHTFESAFDYTLRIMVLSRIALDAFSAKFIFVDLITAVLILWLSVQEIAKKSKSGHLPAKGSFFIFYFLLLISSIHAYTQVGLGFPLFFFQIKFLLLILILRFAFRMSLRERIKFRNGLIRVLTISAAMGLIELSLGNNFFTQNFQVVRTDRFSGMILWPNVASVVYGIALCGVIVSSRRVSIKVLVSLILLGGIIATGTVTGTAATLVGLVWIFRKKYLLFLLLLAIGVFVSIYSGFKINLIQRISTFSIPNSEMIHYQRSTDSATWRIIQWQRVVSVIKDNIYFGLGLGGVQYSNKLGGYLPHSDYLRILVETGITGFIVFLTAAKSAIKKLFPNEKLVKSPLTLACLTIVAVSSVSENLLGQTVVYLIVPFFMINTENRG
jgi:O-antigen ligase